MGVNLFGKKQQNHQCQHDDDDDNKSRVFSYGGFSDLAIAKSSVAKYSGFVHHHHVDNDDFVVFFQTNWPPTE